MKYIKIGKKIFIMDSIELSEAGDYWQITVNKDCLNQTIKVYIDRNEAERVFDWAMAQTEHDLIIEL